MASSRLSPIQRLFGSHLYVLGWLACTCVLLAGIGVNLLMRTGHWPPALVRGQSAVVISGPGSGTPIPMQAYVLGCARRRAHARRQSSEARWPLPFGVGMIAYRAISS